MQKSLIAVAAMLALCGVARADSRCVVMDPSDTPLNVRSEPHGPILGALHNGAEVRLLDTTVDANGRPWAYVTPRRGRSGWVFRAFIDCDG